MHIRPVGPNDRNDWLRMRSALWPDEPETDLARQTDAFLQGAGPESSLLTAVFVSEAVPGRLTGFVELFVRNLAEGCTGPTPYVEGWYVDPNARGSGVGRALMNAAEAWAREHRFTEIASDTPLENETSQHAHRALGFEEVERIVHFRKAL
ncbi:MAG TPA: GNAT family N-acetyltransferase [Rhodothermales bacterium]|nr:GNAT family N-acetyltransferase [Rhodothermales bacterium]